jgi:glycogen debranching enzyme
MEVLADLSERLGQILEAQEWRDSADTLQARLIGQLWQGNRFAMVEACSGKEAPADADSLLPYLPIILGERLPEEIRVQLLSGLTREGRFLTEWGLATESRQSPYYQADGYWRGPIWAPSTMLIIDGLERSGAHALATDLKRRFCTMCARHGFAENFNAVSGKGLRDRAYTWTASVFLLLAHELINE